MRQPGHRGASPPLVRGAGPGGGRTSRRRPRAVLARRAVTRRGRGAAGQPGRAHGPTARRLRRHARATQRRRHAGGVLRPRRRGALRRRPRPRGATGLGSRPDRASLGDGAARRPDRADRVPAGCRRSRPPSPRCRRRLPCARRGFRTPGARSIGVRGAARDDGGHGDGGGGRERCSPRSARLGARARRRRRRRPRLGSRRSRTELGRHVAAGFTWEASIERHVAAYMEAISARQ